jgi:diacylglycerol kinase (ATP)
MKTVLIVANPVAGSGQAVSVASVVANALTARGVTAQIRFTTANEPDTDLDAAILRAERIIAIGGDGTLHRVARTLLLTPRRPNGTVPAGGTAPPAVAFLAMGTGNAAARAFHLPRNPSEIVELVMTGKPTYIDAGFVFRAGSPADIFLLWLGAGLDGAVIHAVAKRRFQYEYKGTRLLLEYFLEVSRSLFSYSFPSVHVASKRTHGEFSSLILANIGEWGIGGVTRKADPRDGQMDLIATSARNRLSWCFAALLAGLNAYDSCKGVSRSRETKVTLSSAESVPVQLDGEPWGELPVSVEIRKRVMPLLIPQGRNSQR